MSVILDKAIKNAPSFKYREFVKSDTAIRLGIKNVPSIEQWRNIELLAKNVLQPVRDKFGPIRITSGFRSQALNSAIGGSKTSNHCFGYAADIEPVSSNKKLIIIIEWIYYNCDFRELIAEYFPQGWVHVAYVENRNDKILKLKDKKHNYQVIDINYLLSLYE